MPQAIRKQSAFTDMEKWLDRMLRRGIYVGNMKKKTAQLPKRKLIPVLVACGLMFAASIILLFTQQKQKLDEEFKSLVASSLNIHTHSNAAQMDRAIANASNTLWLVEEKLRMVDRDRVRDVLEQMNALNPAFNIGYITAEEMEAGALPSLTQANERETRGQLARGETVVGDIRNDESLSGGCFSVIIPLRENGGMTGALYTRIQADSLLPKTSESAVYQDVQSCLITADGSILFNTFLPEQGGNLFAALHAYGLAQTEIDHITDIIRSSEIDSATFNRKGQTYFVSAHQLAYNDWHLVSFVRGPDVLLRSTNIFKDMAIASAISILLAVAAVCAIFLLFLSGRDKLAQEQQRNVALAHRLQAMFNQHSALKVVFDAATGIIVDANPAILNYFGYAKAEVLGRNVHEFNLLPSKILDEKFKGELNDEVLFSAAPHRLKSGKTRLFDVYASVVLAGESKLLYAILFDVTDREGYRNQLLQEKKLLKTTLQSIGDGVVTTDNHGMITGLNSVAENLTGWDSGTAVGRSFTEVFVLQNEETGQTVENPIQKVLETGRVVGLANHTELVNRQSESIPIADSAAPIKSEDGQTFGVVMVFRDVSAEKEHNKQIEFLSYHDPLTGLYNRRYIEEAMSRLDETEYLPISVIMADVNGLKITNDVFGHKAGDTLLKNVASLMKKCCKEGELIARWGGDEFVILMPGTNLETAEAMAKKIKDTHIVIEGGSLSLSLSIGCACKDAPGKSIQTTMQQAEEYMYHQKLLDGKSYRNAIISTLLATLYEKSNETEEHSKRIEKYCHDIGRRLQLSSKEMDELSLLALLHDIGKVSINPNILQKPGALTLVEWAEMKRHPEIGYRIAQATPELAIVADLILSHHERWDGKGYPRGLKGTQIPLSCRILAVADAYDAMTSDRIYRSAMSSEEALCELKRNAGTQFESSIVGFFMEALQSENQNRRNIPG